MKTTLILLTTLLLATFVPAQESATSPAAPAESPAVPPLTLAVLPFDAADEATKTKAAEVAVLLNAKLSADSGLWLVEREDIEKLISEQTLGLSGLADPANAARVGRITGAKILVTGRVVRSGGGVIFVAKIISAETSRVFGETATASDPTALDKPLDELAGKIGKLVTKQRAALVPPAVTREARIAKLRESLKGKPLPTIRVKVTEQDLSRVVIDPAVDTEFGKIVKELGGELVNAESTKDAAVSITGEAISQTGSRLGQLVSARARVEIKAFRAADGKVLATDRETSVAVDTSDAVAGKSALQEAALNLAERVLPVLVAP